MPTCAAAGVTALASIVVGRLADNAPARHSICCPGILLVDEMSLGLAPIIVDRLFTALADLASELYLGVLVVEQHMHVALHNVSRGYLLSGGRVTAQGTAQDLERHWSRIEASYLSVAV